MSAYLIIVFKIILCSLSIVGSGTIIILYFQLGLRSNYALKLITYISICDLLFSVSNLIYIYPGMTPQYYSLCQAQGFLMQFSEQACFIFCFLLCYCIYKTVIRNKDIKSRPPIYLSIGFGIPFILALIPLVTQAYGTMIYACGVGRDDISNDEAFDEDSANPKLKFWLEAGLLVYLPLWGLGLTNIYFVSRVSWFIFQLRKNDKKKSKSSSELIINATLQEKMEMELRLTQRITLNMIAYPAIMLFCWLGNTVYAVASLFEDTQIEWLQGVRFLMADCYGLLNSIVYVVNSLIILEFKKLQEQLIAEKQLQMGAVKTFSQENYSSFLSISQP